MLKEVLVHKTDIELQGDSYQIMVFCRDDGRHLAKTFFTDDDIIINDGSTMEDALAKHERLLPLAVFSRKILSELKNGGRRGRIRL